ncbi:GntR family transcriptional regulator [Streptomyces sp. NPDC088090]|uniref:GntR family transcriptional regulator n=1 Tax=Streptomyces sp. NPDC088090 TaxID=3365822 RepID=UPI00384D7BA5
MTGREGRPMSTANPRGTYIIIAERIRNGLKDDEPGSPLPSESRLMATHQVSRNTIRRSLKKLAEEGFIESVPGIGWRSKEAGIAAVPLIERVVHLFSDESLSVGDRFPSENDLCERFKASRTAVRRALAQLEGRGLLATVHGKGRTVRALPPPPGQP